MLGQRMGFLEVELGPTATRLKEAVRDHFNACRDGFYGLPLWKIFPTAAYRKLMRSEETLYEIISSMVEPAMEQSEDTCPVGAVQSVLMSVLRRDELDVREKKSTIIDFIAAGIHTIGNSTAILLHLVATHPHVQQRLYEEILEFTPANEPLTTRHLQSATYLKACVQESFRLVSTAALLARITSEDMELSGYFVPAGSVVLCHLREACNDERNFVRANEFLPERWVPKEAAKLGLVPHFPFLVAPFGFTRRICPGKKFAELEMSLFLAKTVRRFELSCTAPLQLQFEFLLTPSGEMPIVFRDR
ncbi:hypothetical protein B566_EDAN006782 [Ephemera danica]|nr:hypothetical protein B566_EDAN006782 [Ephemera danica]